MLLSALLLDQRGEGFVLVRQQVGQWRANRAGVVSGDLRASLDDADRITFAAITNIEVRSHKKPVCLVIRKLKRLPMT